MGKIVTVLGEIEASELGVTMPHEHLLIDGEWPRDRHSYDLMLDDEDLACSELAHFASAGGSAICEVSTQDLGRDPDGLVRISTKTNVKIVMGTGWYKEPYYPAIVDQASVRKLANLLIEDISVGSGLYKARPGIIGEIGSHKGYVTAQEERVFRAAARASIETGLSITTHSVPDFWSTRNGVEPVGLAHLKLLLEEGVAPDRVAIGHCTSWMHFDYHLALVELGAFVILDGIGATTWLGGMQDIPRLEELTAAYIVDLIDRGYVSNILVSQDVARKSVLKFYGGHGYDYLLCEFIPRLRELGVNDDHIRTIIVDNPRRLLSIGGVG